MIPRTLLAAVLGVGLGLVFVLTPETVVRAHSVGRLPRGGGEYGSDGTAPDRWLRLVRFVGLCAIAIGVLFALATLARP